LAQFIGLHLKKAIGHPYKPIKWPQWCQFKILKNTATNVVIGETGSGEIQRWVVCQKPLDTFIVKVGSSDNLSDLIDKILEGANTHAKPSQKHQRHCKVQKSKVWQLKPQLILMSASTWNNLHWEWWKVLMI
jgi:hypothetical protein